MKKSYPRWLNSGMTVTFVLFFALALSRVHFRTQTTLIGYRIADLKAQEAALLEERSQLQMQLAKITTKDHLFLMAKSEYDSKGNKPLAANH